MSMKKPVIALVLGTARKDRMSERVALYIKSVLEKRDDLELRYYDVKEMLQDHTIPNWEGSDAIKPWEEAVEQADAFLFVAPEYNHGYPGELKILLDQPGGSRYAGKPATVAGVSAGRLGGARVIEQLIQVFSTLGLVYVNKPLMFGNVEELAEQTDEQIGEQFESRVTKTIDMMLKFAHRLDGLNAELSKK